MNKKKEGPFYWIPKQKRLQLYFIIGLSVLILFFWIAAFAAVILHPDPITKVISAGVFIFLTLIALGHAKGLKKMGISLNEGIYLEQKETTKETNLP